MSQHPNNPCFPTAHVSITELLNLEVDGVDTLQSRHLHSNPSGTIFGGVLIGQALSAACVDLTEGLAPHNLQLNFLTAGQPNGEPVRYTVETLHAGRSFTMRRVTGRQNGRAVMSAMVSFQRPELGPQYQSGPVPLSERPDPEELPSLHNVAATLRGALGHMAERLTLLSHADLRFVNPESMLLQRDPTARLRYWVRLPEAMPTDPNLHACALGYLSDFWFPLTAMLPHLESKFGHGLHVTSLNHSIWFHQPVKADNWLWVEAESPGSSGARGLSIGRVYDRVGKLIASLTQENLFRGWIQQGGALVPPGVAARQITGA